MLCLVKPKNLHKAALLKCGIITFVAVLVGLRSIHIPQQDHGAEQNLAADGLSPRRELSAPLLSDPKTVQVKYPTPISVISQGCSGTTALFKLLHVIMEAHGIPVARTHFEMMLKPPAAKHWWTRAVEKKASEGVVLSDNDASTPRHSFHVDDKSLLVETMNQVFTDRSEETVVFKTSPEMLIMEDSQVARGLAELGAVYRYFHRANVLDVAVCKVRDCFPQGKDLGVGIDMATGHRSRSCFHRRFDGTKVKAKLRTNELVKFLLKEELRWRGHLEALGPYLQPRRAFSYEDLYAFEYTMDEDVFVKCRDLWLEFLSFAIDVNEDVLTNILRDMQGTRELKGHSDVILNIEEVIGALEAEGLGHYLRYD